MSLLVVGLNHRTVPVELLERMTVPEEKLAKALHDLAGREHLLEVVLLSTCNRTEIYARCTHFHAAVGDVRDFLAAHSGADPDEFADHLYTYYDEAAVSHLFSVAAGLDSMIVGESEILGQVRDAWQTAVREQTAPQLLSRMFKHAVESGKRVRTETGISRHPVSIPSAAVAVASEYLGDLDGARVLVIGAGQMGSGLASTLRSRGVAEVVVANRTVERAEELAAAIGASAIPLTDIADTLVDIDVVLTSTASSEVLVERAMVEMVMACRDGKPLLVVDVALPRDVDPGVGDIPDVTLLDLDDLKEYAQRSAERRRGEIGKVREILAAEIERYRAERAAREVGPLVTSLRELAEDIRSGELERYRSKLAKLDPEARELVDAITQGVVNKLLHEPTVRVKDAAGTPRGDYYADALASLFDLPTEPTVESE
ncbi:MAG TPA: glutamyl-tRNA reductase [Acidimicrobiia bacterium]|nr:glutamyl-tRNA reductase [Acidimicrobiia bacterium]